MNEFELSTEIEVAIEGMNKLIAKKSLSIIDMSNDEEKLQVEKEINTFKDFKQTLSETNPNSLKIYNEKYAKLAKNL